MPRDFTAYYFALFGLSIVDGSQSSVCLEGEPDPIRAFCSHHRLTLDPIDDGAIGLLDRQGLPAGLIDRNVTDRGENLISVFYSAIGLADVA